MCRLWNIPFYVSLVIYGISHNLQWISDIEISLQYSYSKENKKLELEKVNQRLEESKYLMKYNSKCKIWLVSTATKVFFWALNVPEISGEDIMSPGLSQHTPKNTAQLVLTVAWHPACAHP